ncbi:hypothetical protein ACOSQ2_012207 [Xanthoceras sorbifolium]
MGGSLVGANANLEGLCSMTSCDVHLRDSPTLVYARFAPRSPTVTHKVLSALGRPGLPRHNALTVLLRLPQIRI